MTDSIDRPKDSLISWFQKREKRPTRNMDGTAQFRSIERSFLGQEKKEESSETSPLLIGLQPTC